MYCLILIDFNARIKKLKGGLGVAVQKKYSGWLYHSSVFETAYFFLAEFSVSLPYTFRLVISASFSENNSEKLSSS